MALFVLLLVFFIVVVLIAAFVYPPEKWVAWFLRDKQGTSNRRPRNRCRLTPWRSLSALHQRRRRLPKLA